MSKEVSPTERQEKQILEWMQAGKYLTPLIALKEFGCLRLGARCFDLRAKNYPVITDMVTDGKKRYASYRLEGVSPEPKKERSPKGPSVADYAKTLIRQPTLF